MIQFNNLEDFKKYAKEKLQETDWSVLPDVTNLINKQEFVDYRNSIRFALIHENCNYQFMNKPDAVFFLPLTSVAAEDQPNTDLPTE